MVGRSGAAGERLGDVTARARNLVIAGLRGRPEEGSPYLRRLLAVQPGFSLQWLNALLEPPRRYYPDVVDHYLEGARRGGAPES